MKVSLLIFRRLFISAFLLLFFIFPLISGADVPVKDFAGFSTIFLPMDIVDVYYPFGRLYAIPDSEKISNYLRKADEYEMSGDMHRAYRYYSYAYQRVKNGPAAPYILFKRVYTVENERILIRELKNILKIYPDFPFIDAVRFELSIIYYLNNSTDDSVYYLDQIINNADSPFYPFALTLKGTVYLNGGSYEDAAHYFTKSISLLRDIISGNKYEQQLMNNYMGLAVCYYKKRDFKPAEIILRKVYGTSTLKNIREKSLFYLYKVYIETNRNELAELCYTALNQEFPESLFLLKIRKPDKNLNNSTGIRNLKAYESIGIKDESILMGVSDIDELIKNVDHSSEIAVNSNGDKIEGGFSVQIGSFKAKANAERVMEKISKYNYPIYIKKVNSGNQFYFKVRVGPFESRNKALDILKELKGYNIEGFVVREKQ